MYGLMVLYGVLSAAAAGVWLTRSSGRASLLAGAVAALAPLTHISGFLLIGGLMLIPGIRHDRSAWRWRAALIVGTSLWVLVWGAAFAVQRSHPPSWATLPPTSVSGFLDTMNWLVQDDPGLRLFVVAALVAGAVVLARRHPTLFRVWVCLFATPVIAGALIGTQTPFFQPRVLAVCSWGVAVALGALVEEAFRVRHTVGVVAIALAILLVLPATTRELRRPQTNSSMAIDYVRDHAVEHDAVAIRPAFLAPLTRWYLSVERPGRETTAIVPVADTDAFVLGSGSWDGRLWLIENIDHNDPPPTLDRCGPPLVVDRHRVWCLQVTATG